MILRFKPESEAEKAVKELIAHRDRTEEYAKDIVERITGIRPVGFGYAYFFGISYSWLCEHTGFDKSAPEEIEGMKFIHEEEGIKYFEPNKRTKKGKEISKTFHDEQTKLRTDSKSLEKFGIFTCSDCRYTSWHIGENEKGAFMNLSDGFMKFLQPHPDVFLESKIPTVQI